MIWCKNFGDNSYISRDIANFVLKLANFRYHGNKVRRGENFNDTLNCATLKTPVWSKNRGHIYYTGREMANFEFNFTNFRYHSNKCRSWVNFRDTAKLCDLENPLFGARISEISRT